MPSSPSLGGRGRRQLLLHCALCSIFCSFSQILLALFLVGLFQLLFCPSPSLVSIPPWPPLSLSAVALPLLVDVHVPVVVVNGTRERATTPPTTMARRWRGARGRAGRPDTLPTRPVRPSLSQAVRSPSSFPSPPPPQSRDSLRCVCRASET